MREIWGTKVIAEQTEKIVYDKERFCEGDVTPWENLLMDER